MGMLGVVMNFTIPRATIAEPVKKAKALIYFSARSEVHGINIKILTISTIIWLAC